MCFINFQTEFMMQAVFLEAWYYSHCSIWTWWTYCHSLGKIINSDSDWEQYNSNLDLSSVQVAQWHWCQLTKQLATNRSVSRMPSIHDGSSESMCNNRRAFWYHFMSYTDTHQVLPQLSLLTSCGHYLVMVRCSLELPNTSSASVNVIGGQMYSLWAISYQQLKTYVIANF